MREKSSDDLLTVNEVAALYGCHPRTIRTWIRKGVIGVVYVGPFRRSRIRRAEAERLLKETPGADA